MYHEDAGERHLLRQFIWHPQICEDAYEERRNWREEKGKEGQEGIKHHAGVG
jgi:hypothetical protein